MEDEYLLRVEGLSKMFPGVHALEEINFEVKPGEVVGLVGENGAGKSTLINIISGVFKQDHGQMIFNGMDFRPNSPQEAQTLGISTIHQELAVVPGLNVAQNLLLNHEPRLHVPLNFIDFKELERNAQAILSELGIENIDINQKVGDLTIALRQMVEIARAVTQRARLILMDEPTSALSSKEVKTLYEIIGKLKAKGVSVVFISHRLEEVLRITDRIIVMRDGHRSGTLVTKDATEDMVINLMVGREIGLFPKSTAEIGLPVLEVRNLSNKALIRNVSFMVRSGEIVGLAGLVGAGRTEVARMICGADSHIHGEILVDGKAVNIKSPSDAVRQGIGLVPEDRKSQGLVMLMNVEENVTLTILDRISSLFRLINRRIQSETANRFVLALSIATPGIQQCVSNLSGGNQQKVVLAKWLSVNPKVLILDEPTRGIDVGAKAEVHALMSKLARAGMGILMISSEMPEILGMSDRVVIMCNGRVTGEFNRKDASEEAIMASATQFVNVKN